MLATFATPELTVIGAVFEAVDAVGVSSGLEDDVELLLDEVELLLPLLPPPPPHAASADATRTTPKALIHPDRFAVNRTVVSRSPMDYWMSDVLTPEGTADSSHAWPLNAPM
jgi:hypothetical protein